MRKAAYRVLMLAVRGRRERGGPWGEAVLAEFDHVTTTGEALRWASGGLRVAVRERYSMHPARYRLVAMALATLAAAPLLVTVHYVPSSGMEPTIAVTSRHVIDQVVFRVTGIDRGDIVAFPVPDAPGDHETLRRVIGLPGDRIECREGEVLRGGTPVDEPYLPFEAQVIGTECAAVTVPAGTIYVLGDNRDVAQDSRHWGPISTDEVTGRVIV
jgi:signal peptidase I